MRIAHLSDLHISENGRSIWDTDTLAHFNLAVEKMKGLKDIDVILISGDIADDGSRWAYDYVDSTLSALNIPVFCCPGNHDDIDFMLNHLQATCLQVPHRICINGWNIYLLNSAVPERASGHLSEEDIKWLDNSLTDSSYPSIICLHHPVIEPEGWLNRKLLDNRVEFVDMITKHRNVKLVLFGHTHSAMESQIGDVIFSAAPSIGFAFDSRLPRFQIANGQEGLNVITCSEQMIDIRPLRIL